MTLGGCYMKHTISNSILSYGRFLKFIKQTLICIIIFLMFFSLNKISNPLVKQVEKKVFHAVTVNYKIIPVMGKIRQWHIPQNTLNIPVFEEHLGPLTPLIQEWKKEDLSGDYQYNNEECTANTFLEKQNVKSELQAKPTIEIEENCKEIDLKQQEDQVMLVPVDGILSSPYGWRIHPIYNEKRFHEGVDVAAPEGKPIKAVLAGTVKEVLFNEISGWTVKIEHDEGLETRYAHCLKILVKEKQKVEKGEVIAEVGESGISTGPHVHFEILKNNENMDPETFIQFKK